MPNEISIGDLTAFDDKLFNQKEPFWQLTGNNYAISLLAIKKQKQFKPKKNTKDITTDDLTSYIDKALSDITKRDYNRFIKHLKADNNPDNYAPDMFRDGQEGFATYLYCLLVESGLYHIHLRNMVKTHKKMDIVTRGAMAGQGLYEICLKYAKEAFPASKDNYGTTIQGSLINHLSQIGKRVGANTQISEDMIAFVTENIQLAFYRSSRFKGVAMTVPMQKVLSMYHEGLCKILPPTLEDLEKTPLGELSRYSKVRVSIEEYMAKTKATDRKEAMKTFRNACERLYEISFIASVKKEKDIKTYKGRLFQSQVVTYRGGIYEMEYSNDFLRYCSTTTPEAFHHGMYQINGKRNPYSWGLGQKLRQHYEINRAGKNANTLSIKRLIEAAPDLPTYKEVMAKDKHLRQRIITPVERDLDELKRLGVLKSWKYRTPQGRILDEATVKRMDYDTWLSLYIVFDLNLPPQDEYIESYRKRLAKAKENRANSIKRNVQKRSKTKKPEPVDT